MLTRLIFRDSHPRRAQLRQLICQSPLTNLVATGITACCLFGTPNTTSAENELQLQAPLNSTLKISSAKTDWQKRDSFADQQAAPTATSAAAAPKSATVKTEPVKATPMLNAALPTPTPSNQQDGDEPSAGGTSVSGEDKSANSVKTLRAIPASGPLDRFRKTSNSNRQPASSSQPAVPLPARTSTSQNNPTDRLPSASSTSNQWQGRSVSSQRDVADEPQDAVQSVPAFQSNVSEGNWVARDAINQVAPLKDPRASGPVTSPSRPASKTVGNQPSGRQTPSVVPEQTSAARQVTAPKQTSKTPERKSEAVKTETDAPRVIIRTPRVIPNTSYDRSSYEGANAGGKSTPNATLGEEAPTIDALPARKSGSQAEPKTRAAATATEELKNGWSADELESLSEPGVASSPVTKLSKPNTVTDLEPKTTPGSVNAADTNPAETDPAKKPFEPKNQAALSSSKRKPVNAESAMKSTPPKQETGASKSPASASVGDLFETEPKPELDYTGRPAKPVVPNRTVASMRRGIERTLKYFYDRPEIAPGRSNWGMMHSMMVFGTDTKVQVGRRRFSTIAWIAGNNNCRGQRLLTNDADGIIAKSGAGLQGHQGQFLAVLGMCNVPLDYPLHAGKVKYNIGDLLEAEKRDCRAGTELTFTLIGLSHYIDTDSRWIGDDGTRWDFERLIAEELKQPIVGAACGGTHRLMGYAHALRKRRAEGKPIEGHWRRAEVYTQDFVDYAYSLQNRDGSMSTKWFEGRADNRDVDRKIQTTGHIVEWLLTLTPNDQLQDPRLVRAVNFLLRSVSSEPGREWSIGPKGHALRSLAMYHQRVFQSGSPWASGGQTRTAQRSQPSRQYR